MTRMSDLGRASEATKGTKFGGPVLDGNGKKAINPLTGQWEYNTLVVGAVPHPAPQG